MERTPWTRIHVYICLHTALTLGGLRILSVGGVCLLKVITCSEWRKQVGAFSLIFICCFNPLLTTNTLVPVILFSILQRGQACYTPGVASSTHAATMTEEEQQREQDQHPPSKNTQQHQQQHIVFHLARRHRHILMKKHELGRLSITNGGSS